MPTLSHALADNLNTVFLVIPSKDNKSIGKEAGAVLASVERTLNAKGISTGIFTLKITSTDYPDLAAKVVPPGIAVLSKGGGIGFVSGRISETTLVQAYVATIRGGGCGTGDCAPGGCGGGQHHSVARALPITLLLPGERFLCGFDATYG